MMDTQLETMTGEEYNTSIQSTVPNSTSDSPATEDRNDFKGESKSPISTLDDDVIFSPEDILDGMTPIATRIYRPTPTGLASPMMTNRSNQYTNWSTRVDPGTLADLFPALDEIWHGGKVRHLIRDHEETVIWRRYHLTEKQRFMACCWNRWVYQMGPIPASNRLEYYISFIEAYGNVMNRAGITREVGDTLHVLWRDKYCSLREMGEVLVVWNEISGFHEKLRKARLNKEARA